MEEIGSVMQTGERKIRPSLLDGKVAKGRLLAVALLAVLAMLAAGLYAWRSGSQFEELAALGYPGVFLVMVIAGAGTVFPMPAQAAVLLAGSVWNPIAVGLMAGLGNATGELFGYAAGRIGVLALGGSRAPRLWSRLTKLIERYGFITIFVIALVPNPLFDLAGLLAGSLGYSVRRFWLACALGNIGKYVGYAYLGDAARGWLV